MFGREEGGLQLSHLLQGFFAFILKHFAKAESRLELGQVTSSRSRFGGNAENLDLNLSNLKLCAGIEIRIDYIYLLAGCLLMCLNHYHDSLGSKRLLNNTEQRASMIYDLVRSTILTRRIKLRKWHKYLTILHLRNIVVY